MNQENWVTTCLSGYRVNPPRGYHFENAHYPLSKKLGGTKTIRLWYPDHIVQGCLQTLENNYPCIDTRKADRERSILRDVYPEYLDLYDQATLICRRHANNKQALSGHREKARTSATQKRKRPVFITCPKGEIYLFESCTEAGRKFNLHLGELSKCCHGKIKHVKGYSAYFADLPDAF
jgi:hypothetical protein